MLRPTIPSRPNGKKGPGVMRIPRRAFHTMHAERREAPANTRSIVSSLDVVPARPLETTDPERALAT